MSNFHLNERRIETALVKSPEAALRGFGEIVASGRRGPAPVHLWNPADCGDIDMRIAADGTWFYCGSPIVRMPLVQLFSSILRKDNDRYVLVTPVEKVGIRVDDAPFSAVEMARFDGERGSGLSFRTNVDEVVAIDEAHPLRFERGAANGLKPYLRVREDLWARITRPLSYDLVALGVIEQRDHENWFGVRSNGTFFPICRASEIEGL